MSHTTKYRELGNEELIEEGDQFKVGRHWVHAKDVIGFAAGELGVTVRRPISGQSANELGNCTGPENRPFSLQSQPFIPHPDEPQTHFSDQDIVLVDRNKYEQALEQIEKLQLAKSAAEVERDSWKKSYSELQILVSTALESIQLEECETVTHNHKHSPFCRKCAIATLLEEVGK